MNRLLLFIISACCIGINLVGCGDSSRSTNNMSRNVPVTKWNIVDLGMLPGGESSSAYDISDNGEVVGESGPAWGPQTGFIWDGVLQPVGSVARSINNYGIAVGVYSYLGGSSGFIRQKNGYLGYVPLPQNWVQADLYSINNIGHVVGSAYRNSSPSGSRGFIYDGTSFSIIEPLDGDTDTKAVAINDYDTVTGYSTSNMNQPLGKGFILNGNNIVKIGFIPGATYSYPQAINNQGSVVGSSGNQAFLYSKGVIKALGFLESDIYSLAYGINDNGDIVGRSGSRAFLIQNGKMIDLSSLDVVKQAGWSSLYEARAINNLGQIVGQGYRNGSYHAYLLTPSP